MRAMRLFSCLFATAMLAATSGFAAPPFWGSSYATVTGPGDVVLGQHNGPVRVGALLPQGLECSALVATRAEPVPGAVVRRDPLIGAPVTVVIQRTACRGDWRDRWVNFIVSTPGGADILDLHFVSPDGRSLAYERVAVQTSTGPH